MHAAPSESGLSFARLRERARSAGLEGPRKKRKEELVTSMRFSRFTHRPERERLKGFQDYRFGAQGLEAFEVKNFKPWVVLVRFRASRTW